MVSVHVHALYVCTFFAGGTSYDHSDDDCVIVGVDEGAKVWSPRNHNFVCYNWWGRGRTNLFLRITCVYSVVDFCMCGFRYCQSEYKDVLFDCVQHLLIQPSSDDL